MLFALTDFHGLAFGLCNAFFQHPLDRFRADETSFPHCHPVAVLANIYRFGHAYCKSQKAGLDLSGHAPRNRLYHGPSHS
eukprot:294858-Pyramimonas_sp.AAC.2